MKPLRIGLSLENGTSGRSLLFQQDVYSASNPFIHRLGWWAELQSLLDDMGTLLEAPQVGHRLTECDRVSLDTTSLPACVQSCQANGRALLPNGVLRKRNGCVVALQGKVLRETGEEQEHGSSQL